MSMGHDFVNIYYHKDPEADNFGVQLFKLIAKADPGNQRLLKKAFPKEVNFYLWWMGTEKQPSEEEVFEQERIVEEVARDIGGFHE